MFPPATADIAADDRWMARALELANQAVGVSDPNPRVGCVIVSADGQCVGEGHTQRVGEAQRAEPRPPHVELLRVGPHVRHRRYTARHQRLDHGASDEASGPGDERARRHSDFSAAASCAASGATTSGFLMSITGSVSYCS